MQEKLKKILTLIKVKAEEKKSVEIRISLHAGVLSEKISVKEIVKL